MCIKILFVLYINLLLSTLYIRNFEIILVDKFLYENQENFFY